jgi:hypothetical protein
MREPLLDAEIANLAIHAQTRNHTLGITGILFLSGDRFVQILEGDRGAVSWLYALIAADPRHQDVMTVADAPLDRRAFMGWYMRLMTADDLSSSERETVLRTLEIIVEGAPASGSPLPAPLAAQSLALAAALSAGAARTTAFGRQNLAGLAAAV